MRQCPQVIIVNNCRVVELFVVEKKQFVQSVMYKFTKKNKMQQYFKIN